MIVVRIELHSARTGKVSELGRLFITNDATGDARTGNYDVTLARKGATKVPQPLNPKGPKPARTGRVEGYPRLSYNVWRLITKALLACFPEERRAAGRDVPAK